LIIDRYIAREILLALIAVLFVLLAIFMSNRFVRYLADANLGSISNEVVLAMLSLKTLSTLTIILPIAFFMAILLAFSRLYKDSEMIAMAACGISMGRIYRSVMALALIVAAGVGAIAFQAAPWAEERIHQIRDAYQARPVISGLAPGRFTTSMNGGVLYFERLAEDGLSMEQVFVQQGVERQIVLSAERGYRRQDDDGRLFLVFENGFRYEGMPGAADFRVIEFEEHAVRIEPRDFVPSFRRQRALPTSGLVGSKDPANIAELQWRISMPLSVLVLALLAVPLSRTNPRQGKYAKLFIAVLVYLIYNNLLGMANTWVARGVIPPLLGLWWVHLGMLAGAWLLLVRQYGLSWSMEALFGRRASALR
jgi:lipopolysaccharide export system permease protein